VKSPRGWIDRHLYEDASTAGSGRHSPRMPKFLPSLLVVLLLALLGTWLLFIGYARLSGYDVVPWSPRFDTIPDRRLYDLARSAATTAALFAGAFAIVYSYRKQRIEEAGSRREDEKELSQRYLDAAKLLGDNDSPAIRLAGVYAMARLADDWPEQRQTCVDVLCAYLRLRSEPSLDPEGKEVRATITSVINQHLRQPDLGGSNWSSLRLDFRGVVFDAVDFSHAHFGPAPLFTGATFLGEASFRRAVFRGGADFGNCRVEGRLGLELGHLQGHIRLRHAVVASKGVLTVKPKAGNTPFMIDLSHITVDPDAHVEIILPRVTQEVEATSRLEINGPRIGTDGWLRIVPAHDALDADGAAHTEVPLISTRGWVLDAGATVRIDKALQGRLEADDTLPPRYIT
jgi:uncharacterized protein YjbI with pentapeptide repeats